MAKIISFPSGKGKDDFSFADVDKLGKDAVNNFFSILSSELSNITPNTIDEYFEDIAKCYRTLLKFAKIKTYESISISQDNPRCIFVDGKEIYIDEKVRKRNVDETECLMEIDALMADLSMDYGIPHKTVLKRVEDILNEQ